MRTYKTDEGLYDVDQLSEEAKISFQYVAELEAELMTLAKRSDILRAAASVFHKTIQDSLSDEALVPEEEIEEEDGGE